MSVVRTADKYIGRNGEPAGMPDPQQRVADITTVAAFLVYMDPDEMWGGQTAGDAFEAFARIINVPVAQLRKLKG
jgi:hypothetical protein